MSTNKNSQTEVNRHNNTRLNTVARRVLLGICWFNGILAPIFGLLMIIFPDGEMLMMQSLLAGMQTWPGADIFFQNLVWPGIALLCVNGISNIVCLTLWRKKHQAYTVIGIICGTLLIAWCTWEMIFIFNGVTVFYMILGIIQTTAAAYYTAIRKNVS